MSRLSHLSNEQLLEYHGAFSRGVEKSKRFEDIKKHDADLKFLYHVCRLLYEAEMILEEGDLDLERNREHLKAIRRGDISEQDIRNWASEKEKGLEKLYENSKLPAGPDTEAIKTLLLNCLEQHYEGIADVVVSEDRYKEALRQIRDTVAGLKEL